jgi:hypothetical protein
VYRVPRNTKGDSGPLLAHPMFDESVVLRAHTASRGVVEPIATPRALRDLLRLNYIASRLTRLDESLFNILRSLVFYHADTRQRALGHIVAMLEGSSSTVEPLEPGEEEFPPRRLYASLPSQFVNSVAPGASDVNWPPGRVSVRLLLILLRLLRCKGVGNIVMQLFLPAGAREMPQPGDGVGANARSDRRGAARGGGSGGGAGVVESATPRLMSLPTSATATTAPALSRPARSSKRQRVEATDERKGDDVHELEEKTAVDDDRPQRKAMRLELGDGPGAEDATMDAAALQVAVPSPAPSSGRSHRGTCLFDRLVCLSMHPMYRSAPRHMRPLYHILGGVAEELAAYCDLQIALNEVAVRDFVVVSRLLLSMSPTRAVVVRRVCLFFLCSVVCVLICVVAPAGSLHDGVVRAIPVGAVGGLVAQRPSAPDVGEDGVHGHGYSAPPAVVVAAAVRQRREREDVGGGGDRDGHSGCCRLWRRHGCCPSSWQ